MTLMSRFVRLFKADVHGVMDQMEDKTLLLRQYLREMETCLGQKEGQLTALGERLERLSGRMRHHREEMSKLEPDLELALKKDKDDIARMLIRRRRSLEIAVGHLESQMETMFREQGRLSDTLADQKLQYEALKTRADAWCHSESDEDPFVGAARTFPADRSPLDVRDEEIELELIRRKEALQPGGET